MDQPDLYGVPADHLPDRPAAGVPRSSIGWMTASPSDVPAGTAAPFKLVAQARSVPAAEVVDYLSFDPDEPQAFVGMARNRATVWLPATRCAWTRAPATCCWTVRSTRGPLFLHGHHAVAARGPVRQPPGELFLGFMGLLFCVANRVGRGAVRSVHEDSNSARCAPRARPAQMAGPAQPAGHRLVWAFVVGLTGVVRAVHAAVPPVASRLVGILEP